MEYTGSKSDSLIGWFLQPIALITPAPLNLSNTPLLGTISQGTTPGISGVLNFTSSVSSAVQCLFFFNYCTMINLSLIIFGGGYGMHPGNRVGGRTTEMVGMPLICKRNYNMRP